MEFYLVLIAVLILGALFVWFLVSGLDRERIREYVESRGGKVQGLTRKPLGRNWRERLYEIRYADVDGHEHQGQVKTGLWTGMHWLEDNIVRYADHIQREQSLEKEKQKLADENQYLRAEIDRLKAEQQDKTKEDEKRFFSE